MNRYGLFFLIFLCSSNSIIARPSLDGPGGLITIPTAYVSSGGTVAPRSFDKEKSSIASSFNYSWQDKGEVGVLKPSNGQTTLSVKYQLTKDFTKRKESSAATAMGFIDLANEDSKAFYGVMSKKAPKAPFVLHLGIMSEYSILGKIRPLAGFESPISKQFLLLGEYNGSKREVNSGFLYHVSENVGSFLYLMDLADAGMQSEVVSGFTFKMAF